MVTLSSRQLRQVSFKVIAVATSSDLPFLSGRFPHALPLAPSPPNNSGLLTVVAPLSYAPLQRNETTREHTFPPLFRPLLCPLLPCEQPKRSRLYKIEPPRDAKTKSRFFSPSPPILFPPTRFRCARGSSVHNGSFDGACHFVKMCGLSVIFHFLSSIPSSSERKIPRLFSLVRFPPRPLFSFRPFAVVRIPGRPLCLAARQCAGPLPWRYPQSASSGLLPQEKLTAALPPSRASSWLRLATDGLFFSHLPCPQNDGYIPSTYIFPVPVSISFSRVLETLYSPQTP